MRMGLSLAEAKHLALHLSWIQHEPTYLIHPHLNADWWGVSHRKQDKDLPFNPWDFIATGIKTTALDKDQKKEVNTAFDAAREIEVNPQCYINDPTVMTVRFALQRWSFEDLTEPIVTHPLTQGEYEEFEALEELKHDDERWEAEMQRLMEYERSELPHPLV